MNSGDSSRARSTSRTRMRSHSRSQSRASFTSIPPNRRPSISRRPSFNDTDEIPHLAASLDNSLPMDFMISEITILIKSLKIKGWYKLSEAEMTAMEVFRISGAMTNAVYRLSLEPCPPLLLRVYGKNVDEIIDRATELSILLKLSQKKIGPRLLGTFANGRFEQFLVGAITLNKEQFKTRYISQMIAKRMKELHVNMEVESPTPIAWTLINKWLPLARKVVASHTVPASDFLLTSFVKFESHVRLYQKWLLEKYGGEFPLETLSFCHNDTQFGNLLLHERLLDDDKKDFDPAKLAEASHKDLTVIDLEYSGVNTPPYELANHFSEWMADYLHPSNPHHLHEEWYPTRDQQLVFIKAYLRFSGIADVSPSEPLALEVAALYNQTIWWRPTVSIFWCLWGVILTGMWVPEQLETVEGLTGTFSKTVLDESNEGVQEADEEATEKEKDEDEEEEVFSYIKYTQQKAAMFYGDAIQLGVLAEEEVEEQFRNTSHPGHVKYILVEKL